MPDALPSRRPAGFRYGPSQVLLTAPNGGPAPAARRSPPRLARLATLAAADPHDLAARHEAEAMVLCAEMFYRASLAREETRGWQLREDCPPRDDAPFLKWIERRDARGEMAVSLHDVPIDRCPVKP